MIRFPTPPLRAGAAALALAAALPAQAAAQAAPAAAPQHILYRVQGEQGTVYLLGSVHLLTPDVYPLGPKLETAFDEAERVFFEVNLDSLAARAAELAARAQYAPGKTLQSELAPETYALLEQKLGGYGLSAAMVNGYEPWMVALTLVTIEYQRAGLKPELGIDVHFKTRAAQAGKPLGALESVDFQLGLFDSFSTREQEQFLQQTLEQLERTGPMMAELVTAWKAGDERRLDALMNESMREYPALYARMLTDRNAAWVPQIERMMREPGDELVVVGAGHLVGSSGVVEMLRRKGYRVEQL